MLKLKIWAQYPKVGLMLVPRLIVAAQLVVMSKYSPLQAGVDWVPVSTSQNLLLIPQCVKINMPVLLIVYTGKQLIATLAFKAGYQWVISPLAQIRLPRGGHLPSRSFRPRVVENSFTLEVGLGPHNPS